MKVVVTGGAGFIGANLCAHLCAGHDALDVVALDDLSTGSKASLNGIGARLVVGSVLDDSLLRDTLRGADAIVHLAARPSVPRSIADPCLSHEANATGTLRVLHAARDLADPLVVVASSSSVYGANDRLPKNEDMVPMPMSPYAVSKLATEQYALAWQYSYGMRTLALRFFNVFGPLQSANHAYAAAVPAFISAALAKRPLVIYGDGLQTRDFTYVGTVCSVIRSVLERGITDRSPINLAYGTRTTLLDLVRELESILELNILTHHADARPGDVRHSQADDARLRSFLPDVEPVPLVDGLRATVNWMRRD